jgi:hypothetical protein
VRIYYKTFAFPRRSHENLGFLAQTPRSQSDLIKIRLWRRVASVLKSQCFFCCEFIEQLFTVFLGLLTTFRNIDCPQPSEISIDWKAKMLNDDIFDCDISVYTRGPARDQFSENILWFKVDFFCTFWLVPLTTFVPPGECDDDWT